MNPSHSLRLLALTIFIASAATAQAADDAQRIMSIMKCASPMRVSELQVVQLRAVHGDASAMSTATETLASIDACEKAWFKDAIAAAGDRADLRDAIKTLYLKDQSYVSSLTATQREQRVAEGERGEAISRVRMEMQLAAVH